MAKWYERNFLIAVYRKLAESVVLRAETWLSAHLKYYRASVEKSTFHTQNDTDKSNFRCTADKKKFSDHSPDWVRKGSDI